MKLIKRMFVLAAAGVLASGCGDDDSMCGDGGCPDGAVSTVDAGAVGDAGPDVMQWGLTEGKVEFNVTAVAKVMDGCGLMPASLVGMTRFVTFNRTTGAIEVGDPTGSPPEPSLGKGTIGGNMATLTRDNRGGDGMMCFWTHKLTGTILLIGHDEFNIDLSVTQSGIAPACMPKPPTDPCTSTWQWTFKKK